MQFNDINIDLLMMKGLTSAKKRAIISAVHMLIFLLLIAAALVSPIFDPATSSSWAREGFVLVGGLTVILIAHGLLFPKHSILWGKRFRRLSYLGYLDWRDNEIRARALREIIRISSRTNFTNALALVEFVPELGEYANLKMVAYQRRGMLSKYINSTARLDLVCRFIYLSHVAELRQQQVNDGNEMSTF